MRGRDHGGITLTIESHSDKVAGYLASAASMPDEATLLRDGVLLAIDATGAHAGAIVRGSAVAAGSMCAEEGHARLALEAGVAGRIVLCAREIFSEEHERLGTAIARVLSLTIAGVKAVERARALREEETERETRNARQLAGLLERQSLLEHLGKVQRAITRCGALRDVIEAIVAGARQLFGDELVSVWMLDPEDARFALLAGSAGIPADCERHLRRVPVAKSAAARAIADGRVIVDENPSGVPLDFGPEPPFVSMAGPLHENGAVSGGIVIATRRPARQYSRAERDVFFSFCEHAAIAIADAHAREATLERALHDPLTGLPNRALFTDRLRHALASSRRGGGGVGVLCIDLDRFKLINDGFGHAAGDQVLAAVADRLRTCLRAGDTASRFGADEFGLLLDGASALRDVVPVAERVLQSLREPFAVGGREVSLGASIGIDVAEIGSSPDEAMRNATVAMHEAKASARGSLAFFEPDMHERLVQRVELQTDLQHALANEEFVLHYQPVVSLETGVVRGFEALVRWEHPTRGFLNPDEFVPFAEELGLIAPIDRWVLRRACEDLRVWRALPGGADLTVSVNLSARNFLRTGLLQVVKDSLQDLPPGALVIEVTETGLVESDAMISTLHELREAGVRIAVDDFGTGYSSLSYLHKFPVDVIKVDRIFVQGIARGAEESALARAILKIGAALGLETVAEGVEDEEQRRILMELGCPAAQGFLFSRPVEGEAVPALIARRGTRRLRSVG